MEFNKNSSRQTISEVYTDLPNGPAYINIATKIIREAGRVFLASSADINRITILGNKEGRIYTSVDQEVEHSIYQGIMKTYSNHNICRSKEYLNRNDSEFTWNIAPLDGIDNVIRGLSICCIALGLRYRSQHVMSVIYAPITDQLFTAIRGCGSRLNYKRLRVVQNKKHSSQVLLAILGSVPPSLFASNLNYDYRGLGSAFLHCCYSASGQLDLAVSFEKQASISLDIPRLILEEAGGVILNLEPNREMFDVTSQVTSQYVAGSWYYASEFYNNFTGNLNK
jgi:myo-inositol-1(or 4)-monophosphatase